jgi:hypothetical protein
MYTSIKKIIFHFFGILTGLNIFILHFYVEKANV